jgi:predicted aminopeptidase
MHWAAQQPVPDRPSDQIHFHVLMLTEILRRPRLWAFSLLLVAVVLILPSCSTTSYLLQAAGGQWQVMHRAKPIDQVIADPATPARLKERLTLVLAAREFASRELHLPDNRSYRRYSDLGRPYVVWNVVAVPELSVLPKTWCFPIAGCVAYRGYFKEANARAFAARLATQGYDVAIDDVPAYSTLGKLADPLLSTMMRYGDDDLAAMIFHELAHQLLYVAGDSSFNEAFATTVEDAGLERWLQHQGKPDKHRELQEATRRQREYIDLFARTRTEAAQIYSAQKSIAEKKAAKAQLFARLALDIHELERRQGVHYALYEEWIKDGLNNARLASLATYYDCVPGFERLLADQGGDLPRFYDAARALSRLSKEERHAKLCRSPTAGTTVAAEP